MNQNPSIFEFNKYLLFKIATEIESNWYGTFLFNNEYERKKAKINEITRSLWTDILNDKYLYSNP